MKKTILLLFITLTGCNFGSSIADQKPTGSGGVAETGGTTGTASGGDTGTFPVGTGGAASGGATETGTGGATAAGMGGAPGTGGRLNGTGGAGLGTEATGGSARGRDGGQPPTGTGGAQGTGGQLKGTGGAPGTGGATGAGGSAAACIPAASPGSRGMNTGQACIDCHVAGGRASQLPFTASGTLYDSATSNKAVSGATVTITGNDGKKVTIVTASDGNFYTNSAIAFPASVQVSKCPDTVVMSDTLTNGNCNSCHGSGMRIHLP
jgi:hypothetical protein